MGENYGIIAEDRNTGSGPVQFL